MTSHITVNSLGRTSSYAFWYAQKEVAGRVYFGIKAIISDIVRASSVFSDRLLPAVICDVTRLLFMDLQVVLSSFLSLL
jgi:hypothetical protein